MNQPPLPFDEQLQTAVIDLDGLREAVIDPETLDAQRYALHGENREGIGQLQDDVIAWTFEGGVWWMTASDGSITGYNFEHYFWLSIRKVGV